MAAINIASRFTKQPLTTDINVVAIVKGKTEPREYFIFLYDDENKSEILRQAGRWAANPELAFTWWDASTVSQQARRRDERCQDGSV